MLKQIVIGWLLLTQIPFPVSTQSKKVGEKDRSVLFFTALKEKDFQKMISMVKSGFPINGGNGSKIPLLEGVRLNDQEAVKLILAHGANINARDQNGFTAVMIASYRKNDHMLRILLAHNPNLDSEAKNGYKAFDYGVESGHVPTMMKLVYAWGKQRYPRMSKKGYFRLMKKGTPRQILQFINTHKVNPQVVSMGLLIPALLGNVRCIERLYQGGIDINQHNCSGYTPLTLAARFGNLEMVKMLVETCKANIGIGNDGNDEASPLLQAARGGQVAVGTYLIRRGINVNKQNARGYMATIASVWYRNAEFLSLLLAHHADPLLRAKDRFNTLDQIYFIGFKEGMKRILIHFLRKSAVSEIERQGIGSVSDGTLKTDSLKKFSKRFKQMLLAYAAFSDSESLVQALLDQGMNPNYTTPVGYSPLSLCATWNSNPKSLNRLLSQGAAPDFQDKNLFQSTPLMAAGKLGSRSTVQRLIKYGASVDRRDHFGDTALNWAVYWGNYDYVEALLCNGASTHYAGKESGDNALDIALRRGFKRIITLLKRFKAKSNRKK